MIYKLYISDHCKSCDDTVSFVRSIELPCMEINLNSTDSQPPIHIMVVPALFENERLVAYGPDIKDYLLRKTA